MGEVQGIWRVAELKRFLLKMKGMAYQGCVMLYGSETWCLRENEMAILSIRTESNGESNVCLKTD